MAKRFTVATAILLCILIVSYLNFYYVDHMTNEIITELEQAQRFCIEGQWADGAVYTEAARLRWNSNELPLHILLRHAETDKISLSFIAVEQYLKLEELDQYSAANQQLIYQLKLLAEMEMPDVKNVF